MHILLSWFGQLFCKGPFQMYFLEWDVLYYHSNFTEICSWLPEPKMTHFTDAYHHASHHREKNCLTGVPKFANAIRGNPFLSTWMTRSAKEKFEIIIIIIAGRYTGYLIQPGLFTIGGQSVPKLQMGCFGLTVRQGNGIIHDHQRPPFSADTTRHG